MKERERERARVRAREGERERERKREREKEGATGKTSDTKREQERDLIRMHAIFRHDTTMTFVCTGPPPRTRFRKVDHWFSANLPKNPPRVVFALGKTAVIRHSVASDSVL